MMYNKYVIKESEVIKMKIYEYNNTIYNLSNVQLIYIRGVNTIVFIFVNGNFTIPCDTKEEAERIYNEILEIMKK